MEPMNKNIYWKCKDITPYVWFERYDVVLKGTKHQFVYTKQHTYVTQAYLCNSPLAAMANPRQLSSKKSETPMIATGKSDCQGGFWQRRKANIRQTIRRLLVKMVYNTDFSAEHVQFQTCKLSPTASYYTHTHTHTHTHTLNKYWFSLGFNNTYVLS